MWDRWTQATLKLSEQIIRPMPDASYTLCITTSEVDGFSPTPAERMVV
jgi:hypothetical protein